MLLERDELPSFAEIGRAVGRTGQAVSAWATADEPPPGPLDFYDRVADYLGADVRWLFQREGEPPQPALWAVWLDYRRGTKTTAVAATATPKKTRAKQIGKAELDATIQARREAREAREAAKKKQANHRGAR